MDNGKWKMRGAAIKPHGGLTLIPDLIRDLLPKTINKNKKIWINK